MSINYKIREFAKYKERLNRSLNSNFDTLQSIVDANNVRNLYHYMQNHQHFKVSLTNRSAKVCTPKISAIYRLRPIEVKLPLISATPHKYVPLISPYESSEEQKPVFNRPVVHRKAKTILYCFTPVEETSDIRQSKPSNVLKKIVIKKNRTRRRSIDSSGMRLMYN